MDYDGVIRVWEAFQGNRADNGQQIPWLVETRLHRVTRSVFDYANIRHFRLLLDQVLGKLGIEGFWRGMRGNYHSLLTTSVQATPGSVFTPTAEYYPITNETDHRNFMPQTRTIPSPNVSTSSGSCQSAGVESQYDDSRDHAFSLLFKFLGRGALTAYRIAIDNVADDPEGTVTKPSGVDENGMNIVTPGGCPEHLTDNPAGYTLADAPSAHAFYPYQSPVDPDTPYVAPHL
jgi:hypothetical protein